MFVCLGNICRSPMAEAILRHQIKERGLEMETASCGTANYHVGDSPDSRTVDVLRKRSICIDHSGQQLKKLDFEDFDYMIVMDESNMKNVLRVVPPSSNAKLAKMRDFDSIDKGSDVDDPWYGDFSDFEICFETLKRSIDGFLDQLQGE